MKTTVLRKVSFPCWQTFRKLFCLEGLTLQHCITKQIQHLSMCAQYWDVICYHSNGKAILKNPLFCLRILYVVVQIFSWFKHFQSSSILIFLCLIFIIIVREKGKSQLNEIEKSKEKLNHSNELGYSHFYWWKVIILQWLQKFSCAHWLIVIVNKRTDT